MEKDQAFLSSKDIAIDNQWKGANVIMNTRASRERGDPYSWSDPNTEGVKS